MSSFGHICKRKGQGAAISPLIPQIPSGLEVTFLFCSHGRSEQPQCCHEKLGGKEVFPHPTTVCTYHCLQPYWGVTKFHFSVFSNNLAIRYVVIWGFPMGISVDIRGYLCWICMAFLFCWSSQMSWMRPAKLIERWERCASLFFFKHILACQMFILLWLILIFSFLVSSIS